MCGQMRGLFEAAHTRLLLALCTAWLNESFTLTMPCRAAAPCCAVLCRAGERAQGSLGGSQHTAGAVPCRAQPVHSMGGLSPAAGARCGAKHPGATGRGHACAACCSTAQHTVLQQVTAIPQASFSARCCHTHSAAAVLPWHRTHCPIGPQHCSLTRPQKQQRQQSRAARRAPAKHLLLLLRLKKKMPWTGRMLLLPRQGQGSRTAAEQRAQSSTSCGRCWRLCRTWARLQGRAWASCALPWGPRRNSKQVLWHAGWRH